MNPRKETHSAGRESSEDEGRVREPSDVELLEAMDLTELHLTWQEYRAIRRAAASLRGEEGDSWTICVCPTCGRMKATNTAKNQLHCSGVGGDRHEGVMAKEITVVPSSRANELQARVQVLEEALGQAITRVAMTQDGLATAYVQQDPEQPAHNLIEACKQADKEMYGIRGTARAALMANILESEEVDEKIGHSLEDRLHLFADEGEADAPSTPVDSSKGEG